MVGNKVVGERKKVVREGNKNGRKGKKVGSTGVCLKRYEGKDVKLLRKGIGKDGKV